MDFDTFRILAVACGGPCVIAAWKAATAYYDKRMDLAGKVWCEDTKSWRAKTAGNLQPWKR